MRSLDFVLLGYLCERQSACQPFDASASVGPDLTTLEVDGRGWVFDNHTILALADQIRAEMDPTPAPVELPSFLVSEDPPYTISEDDYTVWQEFCSSWGVDEDLEFDALPEDTMSCGCRINEGCLCYTRS